MEESGIFSDIYKNEKQSEILEIASKTIITGFFRWVDRCGNPEFVGISKLNLSASDIPGDDYEVTKNTEDTHIFKKEVRKLSDFEDFKNTLINGDNKVSLSFLVALNRLVTIAAYKNPRIDAERKIFDKVNELLFTS